MGILCCEELGDANIKHMSKYQNRIVLLAKACITGLNITFELTTVSSVTHKLTTFDQNPTET